MNPHHQVCGVAPWAKNRTEIARAAGGPSPSPPYRACRTQFNTSAVRAKAFSAILVCRGGGLSVGAWLGSGQAASLRVTLGPGASPASVARETLGTSHGLPFGQRPGPKSGLPAKTPHATDLAACSRGAWHRCGPPPLQSSAAARLAFWTKPFSDLDFALKRVTIPRPRTSELRSPLVARDAVAVKKRRSLIAGAPKAVAAELRQPPAPSAAMSSPHRSSRACEAPRAAAAAARARARPRAIERRRRAGGRSLR